jgi:hypothetical protein
MTRHQFQIGLASVKAEGLCEMTAMSCDSRGTEKFTLSHDALPVALFILFSVQGEAKAEMHEEIFILATFYELQLT